MQFSLCIFHFALGATSEGIQVSLLIMLFTIAESSQRKYSTVAPGHAGCSEGETSPSHPQSPRFQGVKGSRVPTSTQKSDSSYDHKKFKGQVTSPLHLIEPFPFIKMGTTCRAPTIPIDACTLPHVHDSRYYSTNTNSTSRSARWPLFMSITVNINSYWPASVPECHPAARISGQAGRGPEPGGGSARWPAPAPTRHSQLHPAGTAPAPVDNGGEPVGGLPG